MKLRFPRRSSLNLGQILRFMVPSVLSSTSLCATAQPFECGPFEEEGCEVLSWVYPTQPEYRVEVFAHKTHFSSQIITSPPCQCAWVPADQVRTCTELKVKQQQDEVVTISMSRGGEIPAAIGLSFVLFAQVGFTYQWNGELSQSFLISTGQEFGVPWSRCFTTFARDRWFEVLVQGESVWVGGTGLVWCDDAPYPQLRECNVEPITHGQIHAFYMWAPQWSEVPRNCGGAITRAWRYDVPCCSPIVGCNGFDGQDGRTPCCGVYRPM